MFPSNGTKSVTTFTICIVDGRKLLEDSFATIVAGKMICVSLPWIHEYGVWSTYNLLSTDSITDWVNVPQMWAHIGWNVFLLWIPSIKLRFISLYTCFCLSIVIVKKDCDEGIIVWLQIVATVSKWFMQNHASFLSNKKKKAIKWWELFYLLQPVPDPTSLPSSSHHQWARQFAHKCFFWYSACFLLFKNIQFFCIVKNISD